MLTEEIKKNLQMSAEEVLASRDENNYVEGYVQVHISSLVDNDLEGFLDLLSVSLVNNELLMDINYDVVALGEDKNNLILKVRGDASTIVERLEKE